MLNQKKKLNKGFDKIDIVWWMDWWLIF